MEYKWFDEYVEQIRKNDIENAKNVILDNIPEITLIYKYCRGLNRDVTNLYEKKIWLSNVHNFNDPYDSAIMVDCNLKFQYPKGQRNQALEDYQKQMEENKNARELESSLFVSCFSKANNSFPMWGYYADGHRGLCIGYDLRELVKNYDCLPVIYTSKLITYKDSEPNKNILLSSLTKSDEWKHEQEWRIVKQSDKDKGKEGILLEKFANPVEIFVGCKWKVDIDSINAKLNEENTDWFEMYADFSEIINYADDNYVDLYYPIISQKEYKLIDRGIKLNF